MTALRFLRLLATLLAACAALDAQAQFGGTFGRGGGRGGPPGGMDGRPQLERRAVSASGSHLLADHVQLLDNVRYQLRLRPDQEGAWNAYQEKVGALMEDQMRPSRPEGADTATAVRQIERQANLARNRLAAVEDIVEAARGLYERLDERQKGVADRLLPATVPALYTAGLEGNRAGGRERPGSPPEGRQDRRPE